jgi:hypothetical protein
MGKYMLAKLRSRIERTTNERADALPGAIVAGIVSSIVLLGLASVTATVVTQQKDSQISSEATTSATNIDVALRSDISGATNITALSPTSVKFDVPGKEGSECKLITWNVSGTTVNRKMDIYTATKSVGGVVQCDTVVTAANPLVNTSDRNLSTNLMAGSTFSYFNSLGRALVASDTGVVSHKDPAAVGPSNTNQAVTAWNSIKVGRVAYNFTIATETKNVNRQVEQASGGSLYATPADRINAEAGNQQVVITVKPPTVTISKNPVVLGEGYNVTWPAQTCPTGYAVTYTVYENGTPLPPVTANTITRIQTNQGLTTVTYEAVTTCSRSTIAVSSEKSATATTRVIPPVPTLTLRQQPTATNASLTSALEPAITCTYGAPRFTIGRTESTYGGVNGTTNGASTPVTATQTVTTGHTIAAVTGGSAATNTTYGIVQGARYNYNVYAWCLTSANISSGTNGVPGVVPTRLAGPNPTIATGQFTTFINPPTNLGFRSPVNGTRDTPVAQTVSWGATCAVGTDDMYKVYKTMESNVVPNKSYTKNVILDENGQLTNRTYAYTDPADPRYGEQYIDYYEKFVNITSGRPMNESASHVGFKLEGACIGSATLPTTSVDPIQNRVSSSVVSTPANALKFVTQISTPSGPTNIRLSGTRSLSWSTPLRQCADDDRLQMRVVQNVRNNSSANKYFGNYGTDLYTTDLNTIPGAPAIVKGTKQVAYLESRCVSPFNQDGAQVLSVWGTLNIVDANGFSILDADGNATQDPKGILEWIAASA